MTYVISKEIKNRAQGRKSCIRVLSDLDTVRSARLFNRTIRHDQTCLYDARTRQQKGSVGRMVIEGGVDRRRARQIKGRSDAAIGLCGNSKAAGKRTRRCHASAAPGRKAVQKFGRCERWHFGPLRRQLRGCAYGLFPTGQRRVQASHGRVKVRSDGRHRESVASMAGARGRGGI